MEVGILGSQVDIGIDSKGNDLRVASIRFHPHECGCIRIVFLIINIAVSDIIGIHAVFGQYLHCTGRKGVTAQPVIRGGIHVINVVVSIDRITDIAL